MKAFHLHFSTLPGLISLQEYVLLHLLHAVDVEAADITVPRAV